MKKFFTVAMCILLVCVFAACNTDDKTVVLGTADNEILTYRKLDAEKTHIVVSYTGNIEISGLVNAFETANPDVEVVTVDITGGTKQYAPYLDAIENDDAPDVMFFSQSAIKSDVAKEYFVDLSDFTDINNFKASALSRIAADGHVYFMPGPSDITCVMYNKTLFNEYGWTVPKTFDEFVALCRKIKEDTNGDIAAFNANAKYDNELNGAMQAFTYAELFGGENRAWFNELLAGNGTLSGHLEPYFEAFEKLVDCGVVDESSFSFSATTRKKLFREGKIAMMQLPAQLMDDVEDYEFGFMPFPCTQGELGYIMDTFSSVVGMTKKTRDEKTDAAVKQFLSFFATEEGQSALIGASLKASNLKDKLQVATSPLSELNEVLSSGHMFSMFFFEREGYTSGFSLYNAMKTLVKDKTSTIASVLSDMDSHLFTKNEDVVTTPVTLATVSKNFTVLETSMFIADLFRENADADIGLIANNVAYRGNLLKIYKGTFTEDMLTPYLPRSYETNSKLTKYKLTGAQLLDVLNNPKGENGVADCTYAFSGLKCTIAPWNAQGERLISVTLADGTAIDPDAFYTVAAWAGTISDEYATEVVSTVDTSFVDMMRTRLTTAGTIAPFDDNRLTLQW